MSLRPARSSILGHHSSIHLRSNSSAWHLSCACFCCYLRHIYVRTQWYSLVVNSSSQSHIPHFGLSVLSPQHLPSINIASVPSYSSSAAMYCLLSHSRPTLIASPCLLPTIWLVKIFKLKLEWLLTAWKVVVVATRTGKLNIEVRYWMRTTSFLRELIDCWNSCRWIAWLEAINRT